MVTMRFRTTCVLVVVGSLLAGDPMAIGQQQPQFRAAVDLVHIDVSVLDDKRQPVRGLTAADFQILEDGRLQEVATFAAIDFPDVERVSTSWVREVAPDTRRNDTLDDRRLFVLVLDDAAAQLDIGAVHSARLAARAFVDRLGPLDLAAVVLTLNSRHSQDYTNDRAKLRRAIDAYGAGFRDMGDLPGGPDTDEFHYQSSIDTIGGIAKALASMPQRRKTLVYISQGVPMDPDIASAPVAIGSGQMASISESIMHQRLLESFSRAIDEAQRANVNVYALDPCGLRVPPAVLAPDPDRMRGSPSCVPGHEQRYLRGLAESTGGRAALDQNDLTPAVEQIFVENASYYILGMRSDNPRRDGKRRRLEVRVPGRRVDVRARNGYIEPSAKAEARAAEAALDAPLRKAISGLLPKPDLPLQVWATALPLSGMRDARVGIGVGLRHRFEARTSSTHEVVDLTIQAFSPDGRPRGAHNAEARLQLRPGAAGDIGFEVTSSIRLPPGRYQLRIGAMLRSSRTSGSVYYDVEVPDFSRGSIQMSGLALHARPAVPSARTDAEPWLPDPVTTNRVFERTDRVTMLSVVYRRRNATTVPWKAEVVDAGDRTVWQTSGAIDAAQFRNALANLQVPLPMDTLESGAYLLRVNLGPVADAEPIVRDLRFWVR